MCGFFGFVNDEAVIGEGDVASFRLATGKLSHRGPDR